MLQAFGGHVLWSQLPAFLIGEFVGGALGGLAWVAIGRVRVDATAASLAPADPEPERISGAAS
jgi:glycerol uptake facilitator protein